MFKSARLKLTAWYLLIIMSISIAFSLVIFRVLTREFERFESMQRHRIERRFYGQNIPQAFMHRFPLPLDPELMKEIKQRLTVILVIINGGILLVSGGLAYFLAGRTLEPIREMIDEQNRFVSDASHELRTPLTSLKTAMEVAARDKKFSLLQAKKLISENIAEVDKLQSLSDQLLRLAQFEKPNGNLVFEKIDLKKIIESARRKVGPIAKAKKISIKTNIEDMEVKGHSDSLVEFFVILLDNAVKYSPKASIIEVNSKRTDGSVLISVKDRGVGIAEKDLPHVFNRFYRADNARQRISEGGYGLGLSIAKRIVELHRGTISVESKLKKGSIFTIRLPV